MGRNDCIQAVLIRKCHMGGGADFSGVYVLGNLNN